MATEKPVVIGYSGSLAWFSGRPSSGRSAWKKHFWTYNHLVTDPDTRSAYFLLKALQTAVKQYGLTPQDLRVELWGNIDSRNRSQVNEMGLQTFVSVSGYLPKMESIRKNESCDILFLPMESATPDGKPLFIPGKAFEYMKAGKPVLALSGDCDCMDILRPSGLLEQFEPHATEKISAWLNEICKNRQLLGKYKADDKYIEQYDFRNITGKLASVFEEVLHHGV